MSKFIKTMDNLPWIVKIILCIPALDIVWGVYRIVKGLNTKKTLMLIVGILWIIPGVVFAWVLDLICTIIFKNPVICA